MLQVDLLLGWILWGLVLVGAGGCISNSDSEDNNNVTPVKVTTAADQEKIKKAHEKEKKAMAEVSGTKQEGANFVGAQECATCHDKIYAEWKKSVHNNPSDEDSTSWLDKKLGDQLSFEKYDGKCRSCHVLGEETSSIGTSNDGYNFDEAIDTDYNKKRTGIQCEHCHGPASNHLAAHKSDNIAKAATISKTPVYDTVCTNCHTSGDYKQKWEGGASTATVAASRGFPLHAQSLAFLGTGGYHYEQKTMPKSWHFTLIKNGCVDCHVSTGTAVQKHSLKVDTWDLEFCQKCHDGDIFGRANIIAHSEKTRRAAQDLEALATSFKAEHTTATTTIPTWDDEANELRYYQAMWNANLALSRGASIHNPPYIEELLRLSTEDMEAALAQ